MGGDSIITIQLVSRALKKGIAITPKDVFEHQTISKLSQHIGKKQIIEHEQLVFDGEVRLLPIQSRFFELNLAQVSHYNQSVLLCIERNVSVEWLDQVANKLLNYHDALRFRYKIREGVFIQYYGDVRQVFFVEDIGKWSTSNEKQESTFSEGVQQICESYQRSLDISEGSLFKIVLIKTGKSDRYNRLLLVAHHLIVDGVSWRVLLENIESGLLQLKSNQELDFGMKGTSYKAYADSLFAYGKLKLLEKDIIYWQKTVESAVPLKTDKPYSGRIKMKDVSDFNIKLDRALTNQLIKGVSNAYQTDTNDLLLCALMKTVCVFQGAQYITLGLEGHGREPVMGTDFNLSTTTGWFTCLCPIKLETTDSIINISDLIKSVKEQLRAVPGKGLSYGVLRYMHESETVRSSLEKTNIYDVVFNYLGQLDNVITAKSNWFKPAKEFPGIEIGEDNIFEHKLLINCQILGGELSMKWSYPRHLYEKHTIQLLAENYIRNLQAIILHCQQITSKNYTPSDYGLPTMVSYKELETFLGSGLSNNDEIIF